ncbi:MAG: HDOD domain-containing protein [Desulfobulbaceae bacterium]|jgi:putative nucleotidyltransferase with HDIG domain|nr:HDOD domain-containing protein [Desulfobulbaceae bacterium]
MMNENIEKIIERFNHIHPTPMALNRLSQLLVSEDATLKDVEDVIKVDPLLVARILGVVNSAYYSPLQKIDSLGRAVAYLGMRNLHILVITDTLKALSSLGGKRPNELRLRIWRHSAAVSIAAKMIAERVFGVNGDNAYLAGILHDFGQIVEEQLEHDTFAAIVTQANTPEELVALEQRRFGLDHCQIGAELCRQWMISPAVTAAILGHHQMEAVAPDSFDGILRLAEYLTGRDNDQGGRPHVSLNADLLAHVEGNRDEYAVLMDDFPAEMQKADELYGARAA